MLQESWNVKNGSYVLTIISGGEKGALATSKVINKYASIANVMHIDTEKDKAYVVSWLHSRRRNKRHPKQIIDALEKKDYSVAEVEDLQNSDRKTEHKASTPALRCAAPLLSYRIAERAYMSYCMTNPSNCN